MSGLKRRGARLRVTLDVGADAKIGDNSSWKLKINAMQPAPTMVRQTPRSFHHLQLGKCGLTDRLSDNTLASDGNSQNIVQGCSCCIISLMPTYSVNPKGSPQGNSYQVQNRIGSSDLRIGPCFCLKIHLHVSTVVLDEM